MDLPDDVAIRTSDHSGKILGEVNWLCGRWIEVADETEEALFSPMLDAHDDLQSSIFDALHGYYRSAFSAFRNVIEVITIGTCGALTHTPRYKKWQDGLAEFGFGAACDLLSNDDALATFNGTMRSEVNQSLWDAKQAKLPGGYGRRLYREMSNFTHSHSGFTDGDLRSSNGPIYVPSAFWDWYCAYLRTVSLCSILISLARPHGDQSVLVDLFTNDPTVLPVDLLHAGSIVGLHQ